MKIENTNNPTLKAIKTVVKKVSHEENTCNNFTRELYQTCKKQIILILYQLFQKRKSTYILNYKSILHIIKDKKTWINYLQIEFNTKRHKIDRGWLYNLKHKVDLSIGKSINVVHHINILQKKNINRLQNKNIWSSQKMQKRLLIKFNIPFF